MVAKKIREALNRSIKGRVKTAVGAKVNAVKTRLKNRRENSRIVHIAPTEAGKMIGAGVQRKGQTYITHTSLHHHHSAIKTFNVWQKAGAVIFLLVLIFGLLASAKTTMLILVAALTIIYFLDFLFNGFLILKSLHFPPEIFISDKELKRLDEKNLPVYSVLCPLYHEARVLPQFVESIENLDWPKNKLDVLLLLEENDQETIGVAKSMTLPEYIRVIIVPDSKPKTKPKACNYGLGFAKGEYVVVYDAEDKPDADQLKKAYLAFKKVKPNVFCLQAKLNYYNPHYNLLTKLFTAEYSLWFDVILPGLQSIETTIPLGGTSNHFRLKNLIALEGWDPFNVTEDCDLGVRLFKRGYTTAIFDSTTLEEANSNLKNWLRQRSRWVKGYMQTYLVHMRHPRHFLMEQGIHALLFQLVVGGKIISMLINPFLWLMTISYFVLYRFVGPAIESLYPAPIFYMAAFSLIFGNFMYLYNYMIGCAKRGHWPVVKYVFLAPLYWLGISVGAFIALEQLIFKPHYWEKTHHGLHLTPKEKVFRLQWPAVFGNFSSQWSAVVSSVKTGVKKGGLLLASALVINFLNFLYNAYLGRHLKPEDFGLISVFGSLIYLVNIPLSAIGGTVTYRSGFLYGKYGKPVTAYWQNVFDKFKKIVVFIVVGWILFAPFIAIFFKEENLLPFLVFSSVWFFGIAGTIAGGFLSGIHAFNFLAIAGVCEAAVKFAASVIFVDFGFHKLAYLAMPVSIAFSFLILLRYAGSIKEKKKEIDDAVLNYFPKKFFTTSLLTKLANISFVGMDVILAKHFLSAAAAGEFALLALAGKMIYFFGSLFNQFLLPIVSKNEGAGLDSKKYFRILMFASSLVCFIGFLGIGLFGPYTVPILFGSRALPILNYLPYYGLAVAYFTFANTLVIYYQAKKEYLFSIVSFLVAIIQTAALFIWHKDIWSFTLVSLVISTLHFFFIFELHFFLSEVKTILRNLADMFGLFQILPDYAVKDENKLKILIFNWRDTKHIWAGGAEVYLHEIAKRLTQKGNTVTLFCGNDGHNLRYETIDGVHIIRRGGFYTVYFWAVVYYLLKLRKKFDLIIDAENGIPFFTPLYVKKPVFGLIFHVHQEVFLKKLKLPFFLLPIAVAAKILEKKFMPLIYKGAEMITISPSTKKAMEDLGFKKEKINIIYPGVELEKFKPLPKTRYPSVLYLGRLKAYKSVNTLIRAMEKVIQVQPKAKLIIAGFGESRPRLEKLTKKLGLENVVDFLGRVTEETKVRLMAKSWVFVCPSSMEGWGITVVEANACGTPVVAADVPGLRDSVRNPGNGFLVPHGDVNAFADKISLLIEHKNLRKKMETFSLKWAEKFSWDKTVNDLDEILK